MRKFLLVLFLAPFLFSSATMASEAGWKEQAVIYGLSPSESVAGYDVTPFKAIRERLPEIKALGANILWLMPISTPADPWPDQGYDVVDFFKIKPALGTENDLRELVTRAHRLGLKVILDVPLNHTSIQHPLAQAVVKNGKAAPEFHFFQPRSWSQVPYAEHYHERHEGRATFTYYFWDTLVNLNYDNEHVREYALRVLEHWITEFDVDGYRLDASWGPQSRWPGFYRAVSNRLRKLKPDIFILAEDKAGFPANYVQTTNPHFQGSSIDAAYDWNNADSEYISKWSFQNGAEFETVFNHQEPVQAAEDFVNGVRRTLDARVRPLRYLESNDTPSFLKHHSLQQTRFAATVMMLLPGVPLIFYGQEVGHRHDQWRLPSFDPKRTVRSYDPSSWRFYQSLVKLRNTSKAFALGKITDLRADDQGVVRFSLRWKKQSRHIQIDFKDYRILVDSVRVF